MTFAKIVYCIQNDKMGFTIDSTKYYVHANAWWWGTNYSIIRKDGNGMVEIQFDRELPETAYIKGLSVLQDKRQQGIGLELLSLCEDIAEQSGMVFIRLSVEKGNDWLFEWYKRMGFHILSIEEHVFEMIKPI